MSKQPIRLRVRSMAWVFAGALVVLNGAFARSEVTEETYTGLFRDYLQVARIPAEKMDISVLSKVTDELQKGHQESKLV